ncbi:hypothetical protein [Streptomyces sp. SID8352]|uniref:hypothetical protein n=1 Tax=Streptomyces sp. SID8352 TaxID=2690338 RepID=UPI001367F6E5|nr:hypothetical protein [Streptomyces sp. SID8352]MYU20883.1 hypothetical protein [Streptomyces sp. SID8352]
MAGLAAAVLGLGLAACSTDEAEPSAAGGKPAAETTGAAPSEAPSKPAWEAPASCTALSLRPGATLAGGPLGTCVSEALSSHGSGKMRITADTFGDVEFTYDPEYNFQGELTSPEGPVKMVFLDGTMWIDQGDGPVKGDRDSDDPQEQLVGVTGELYRVFSDVKYTAEMVRSQPVWKVDDAKDSIELPDGKTAQAYRITSDGAFTWNGFPVQDFVLWFAEDWTPVGDQATVEVAGTRATHTQHFYDLGEPVEITPLG